MFGFSFVGSASELARHTIQIGNIRRLPGMFGVKGCCWCTESNFCWFWFINVICGVFGAVKWCWFIFGMGWECCNICCELKSKINFNIFQKEFLVLRLLVLCVCVCFVYIQCLKSFLDIYIKRVWPTQYKWILICLLQKISTTSLC